MKATDQARLIIVGLLVIAVTTQSDARHRTVDSPPHRTRIRLVLETNFNESLANEYRRLLPDVDITVVEAIGSVATVAAITHDVADVGFVLADVGYADFAQAAQPVARPDVELRGIASIEPVAIHLLVRSGLAVRSIRDLVGRRIGLGTALAGQSQLADLIFRNYGIGPGVVQQADRRANLLVGVDAAFATSYYPAPTVVSATLQGARLIPIDGEIAAKLRRQYPFVKAVTIPAGTYRGQDTDVTTLGIDRLLIVSSQVSESVAHDLTRVFIETLPQLSSSLHNSLRLTNLKQAAATPIPLHEGAARYYRERELMR